MPSRLKPLLEARTLVALAAASGFAWIFGSLADEVAEGETHAFDTAVLLALRAPADTSDPLGPAWVEELARDVTALGSMVVLTFLTAAVVGFLGLIRRRGDMALVLASVGGGLIASTLFKHLYDRARPDLVPHETAVYTASFPSGHSMLSAATFLTLGALLARMQRGRIVKAYLMAAALVVTLAVGVSRVYLGVHWPTDVLAGWSAGAAWALGCWTVARLLQARGAIEPAAGPPEGGEEDGLA